MHASHSCILVTESSENEPVEPTESVEPEPGILFVVEPEVNPGKQLSIIPCTYLIWQAAKHNSLHLSNLTSLVISLG